MSTVTFHDIPCKLSGDLPAVGSTAPDFKLVGGDLGDVTLASFAGKTVVLNIVPSLDTAICAMSAKRFNTEAANLKNVAIINVSADLPFAQKRFCESEKLSIITNASTFRSPEFGRAYGTTLTEGPAAGLEARAIVVIDRTGKVAYTQLVPEVTTELDYDAVMTAVKSVA